MGKALHSYTEKERSSPVYVIVDSGCHLSMAMVTEQLCCYEDFF